MAHTPRVLNLSEVGEAALEVTGGTSFVVRSYLRNKRIKRQAENRGHTLSPRGLSRPDKGLLSFGWTVLAQ
jgi:hypothetical protein